ncbi:hypothetical protein N9154_01170 [Akkermansiaceae bacterium]|nr:hypothetical protein [Akkermansiaceae bacterium]
METFIAVREKVGKTLAVMLIDGSYKPTPDQLCVVITFDMVLVSRCSSSPSERPDPSDIADEIVPHSILRGLLRS